jgi:pyridoxal phosphate enzyme (YggS family)
MKELAGRLDAVREQIAALAQRYDREPASVHLLAVSKTKPASDVRAVAAAGQLDFGENHLQDAMSKIEAPELAERSLRWHFIGPLQSNKTRPVAEHFHWVHSIDRVRIARRLNDHRPESLPRLDVCLQVNIDGEASKSGVAPADVAALAREVAAMPRLRLRGLMAIPRPAESLAQQRLPFARLRELKQQLEATLHEPLDTLSMGMSGDLEAAIAEGATWVRVGTAIFGARART